MNSDVKILTLYKQHYLDEYDKKLASQYSCWGYYDGMDITEVDSKEYSKVIEKQKLTPISHLWYKAGEKIPTISGQYSVQNVGLIRCICDNDYSSQFWCKNNTMLFFSVAFLQLTDVNSYLEFGQEIEDTIKFDDADGRKCQAITYCTLDNADLVVLFHSNSLSILERQLQQLEEKPEVRYQHCILGVSEKYLEACMKQGEMLERWQDIPCFINESVQKLDIRLVTSGENNLINLEKNILDEIVEPFHITGLENARYSYVTGHENMVISLENTDVKSMLVLLLPNGFVTHQNATYSAMEDSSTGALQPRLYNIETTYIFNHNPLNAITGEKYPSNTKKTESPHNLFQKCMERYKGYVKDKFTNEGMYACYLGLLKTLNMLVQYERFNISEDIYYLLYPSFKVFDNKIMQELASAGSWNNISTIKPSIREYTEAVNSVVYHTIHTDQVFLMIPGNSGTSFSIPIKLNLMFLWFTECVVQLLGEDKEKYKCILVPTIESKPITKRLRFFENEKRFLICVKISQRTLYMPQSLMIILAHEMGHYIGGDVRCRTIRKDKLIEFAAKKLADIVFGEIDEEKPNNNKNSIRKLLHDKYKVNAQNIISKNLDNSLKESLYGDVVERALNVACLQVLLSNAFFEDDSLTTISVQVEDRSEQFLYDVYKLIRKAQVNAIKTITNNTMVNIIKQELAIYREAFSDIIAIKLLQCKETAFVDAFYVSEGLKELAEPAKRRIKVFKALGNRIDWSSPKISLSFEDELLYSYLCKCNEWISGKLQYEDNMEKEQTLLQEVRNLYNLFSKGEDADCGEIYSLILECIKKMKEDIGSERRK